MPTNRLTQPKSLDDMLLYVLWQLQAAARRRAFLKGLYPRRVRGFQSRRR